jgi:hypothetical protein
MGRVLACFSETASGRKKCGFIRIHLDRRGRLHPRHARLKWRSDRDRNRARFEALGQTVCACHLDRERNLRASD